MADATEFQRYAFDDQSALNDLISEFRVVMETARQAVDLPGELKAGSELGSLLTIARREREATILLEDSLSRATGCDDSELAGYLTLHLATAKQYLGERDAAQILFRDALAAARTHRLLELEHYVLHHRGRCSAEQGNVGAARADFLAALDLRIRLKDSRAASTRRALEALDGLSAQRSGTV